MSHRSLSRGQFKGLYEETVDPSKSGGFSIQPTTGETPEKGFMVSEHGSEEAIPLEEFRPSHLPGYVRRNREAFQETTRYLGGWREPSSVALDRSRQFSDESKAGVEMIHQNQRAMYDLDQGESIGNPYYQPGLRKKVDIERDWDRKY